MPKIMLTAAERRAGVDLRDVMRPILGKSKPRVSKSKKRELAAERAVTKFLTDSSFKLTGLRVNDIELSISNDLRRAAESCKLSAVEVEVTVRFFIGSKIIDDEISESKTKRQTRVRGSRS